MDCDEAMEGEGERERERERERESEREREWEIGRGWTSHPFNLEQCVCVCLAVLSWSVVRTRDLLPTQRWTLYDFIGFDGITVCEHVGRFYPTTTQFWKESMEVVAMRLSRDMDFPKQPTGRYWNMLASKIGDKSVTYHGYHSALSRNPISPYSSFQSSAASHSHRVIWGVSRHCRFLGATASLAVAWFECGSSENNNEGSFRAY